MANKYLIGFLVMVLLSTSIYIMLPDNVRIDVGTSYTYFKVWEGKWVVSAKEATDIFSGSTKVKVLKTNILYDIKETNATITRNRILANNITLSDIYYFDGSTKDKTLFPIKRNIVVSGAKGKILQVKVSELYDYKNRTRNATSPSIFGKDMEITWQNDSYYNKIEYSKVTNRSSLIIKYKITEDNQTFNVRVFDPPFPDYGTPYNIVFKYGDAGVTYFTDEYTYEDDCDTFGSSGFNQPSYWMDGSWSTHATTDDYLRIEWDSSETSDVECNNLAWVVATFPYSADYAGAILSLKHDTDDNLYESYYTIPQACLDYALTNGNLTIAYGVGTTINGADGAHITTHDEYATIACSTMPGSPSTFLDKAHKNHLNSCSDLFYYNDISSCLWERDLYEDFGSEYQELTYNSELYEAQIQYQRRDGNESSYLVSPSNNSLVSNSNQTFVCNVSNLDNITSIQLNIWNSTNSLIYTDVYIPGSVITYYNYSNSYILPKNGTYRWSCNHTDQIGDMYWANNSYFYLTYNLSDVKEIYIVSPVNNTEYSTNNIDLDWYPTFTTDWCAYSLDGGANNTNIHNYSQILQYSASSGWADFPSNLYLVDDNFNTQDICNTPPCSLLINYSNRYSQINISLKYSLEEIQNNITVSCNNGSSWNPIYFNNGSGFSTIYYLNITINDSTCLSQNKIMLNYSFNGVGEIGEKTFYEQRIINNINKNITLTSLSEGNHNVTIWCNDTLSNMFQSAYTYFSVDSIVLPFVNLSEPINNTVLDHTNVIFNFTLTEGTYNVESCSLYIDEQLNQTMAIP
jgi:hypothetical protein